MKLLNGLELATKIKNEVKNKIDKMMKHGQHVSLAVIQVGNNSESSGYVRNKERACELVGIKSKVYKIEDNVPVDIIEDTLLELIDRLNKDNNVHGILVQLPLPKGVNEDSIINKINPDKDVDGFHESNVGKLTIGNGNEKFIPCTTYGVIELLKENNIKIEGQNCVVVGRSNIVGKPTALELLHHNGTVTICHSKTNGLKEICKGADILVCAIGKPKFFNKEYISPNTVVVDVGIHYLEDGTMCGDVDFDDVKDIVSAISPVPKGVGAMTVAMLMYNCLMAAQMQYKNK